ncbi:hypothetical protein [Desulforhabdus sp. TSK]|uniref:hypothetical protein n=1 Tax=Desulforhabdus sp. TSK TaxID=2925014 RepID=UPI001FC8A2BD|nr:hypothetical protein [Desulforhabdus sp. TSK]GKT08683.1 hypothetical protein DSTSK_19880 [Desulforhabdus sp. TSK]
MAGELRARWGQPLTGIISLHAWSAPAEEIRTLTRCKAIGKWVEGPPGRTPPPDWDGERGRILAGRRACDGGDGAAGEGR